MRVIDSHTEGEPTRVIVDGGPPLGDGPLAERRARFAREFDHFRRFAVNEPRGHDAMVGALLCEPHDPSCAAGVIFFNNVGYLGMCGHGTIGLAVTLAHMGRLEARAPSLRDAGRDRWRRACRRATRRRSRMSRAIVSPRRFRSRSPASGPCAETSPGAATGSSSPRPRLATSSLANVGRLTRGRDRHSRRARAPGRERQGRRADRPHRVLRPGAIERREQPQFRPLPRRRLRPVAVRNRHQRQARLPPCRRKVAPGRGLGAGKHHRQPLSRKLRTGPERRRSAAHQRARVRLRRKQARRGPGRPVPVRVRRPAAA